MRKCLVELQAGILSFMDYVGSMGVKDVFKAVKVFAYEDSFNIYFQLFRESAGFREQFEAYLGNGISVGFTIYYYIIHGFLFFGLTYGVVSYEFDNKFLYLLVVGLYHLRLFGLEYHTFNVFNLCR